MLVCLDVQDPWLERSWFTDWNLKKQTNELIKNVLTLRYEYRGHYVMSTDGVTL